MKRLLSVGQFEWLRNTIKAERDDDRVKIFVCMTGCRAYGASDVFHALEHEVKRQFLEDDVEVRSTGCHGFCAKAPVVAIEPHCIQYQEVSPDDAEDIINLTVKGNKFIDRLAYRDIKTNQPVFNKNQIPFYKSQVRRVLKKCGRIDPTNINHYLAEEGYTALTKILSGMTPEEVISEVTEAKLRGRGGAGFSTGTKWKFAREAPDTPKYIICNADEGDPGAFMDRALLEGDPHAVIEGLMIGAYAIGAEYGFIYVREEYPIAVEHLSIAIGQLGELGLLGDNILGTGFNFHLSLKMGAGAFVCGEETALMASIEGGRGMPRARPPYPAIAGLDRKPTNINNVETLANIPLIINYGTKWYSEFGTDNSKGTKIFSLAGKVNNTGLVEVPIGIALKEIIFDIGGGIPKGRKFKAVQMGGPSGGCVPRQFLNLPVDYDTLQKIGAIMGSGGMVVMDENNCMVEIARFFLNFTQSESCGKCAPCRLGTTQLLKILTKITRSEGSFEDLNRIRNIGKTITETSLCGLGQTCAKPALSTLKYFIKEYEDHIQEQRCEGAVCSSMVISPCQHACPAGIDVPNYIASIAAGKYRQAVEINRERNPFPAICGRICIHPCEYKCRRGELDEPIAIRLLKRFAADWYFDNVDTPPVKFSTTRKESVAIVGAGPAGLTCAYFLTKAGFRVTVFEAKSKGGGMMNITIPAFRLPKDIVQLEVDYIKNCGVTIHYNSPIDASHTVHDLMEEGFSAVFIAPGAQASRRMGISGETEQLKGLMYGLQFLEDIRSGADIKLKGKVVVVGGGNVALDVARTALRAGADAVQLYYRRTLEEMPAWGNDIKDAVTEGIGINTMWAPKKILQKNNTVTGIEFSRSKTLFNEDGTSELVIDDKSTQRVDTETVIISVGQAPDVSFLSKDSQIERSLWGSLEVNENSLSTNIPGIFAGGDFTTGPTSAIRAISSGRRAAVAIDKYLSGDNTRIELPDEKTQLTEDMVLALESEEENDIKRAQNIYEEPVERIKDFREVERGFTREEAKKEALRCLRCDLEREII